MKHMVDIDVVLDEQFPDPQITIRTKSRTGQVENIIEAIENAADNGFPMIPGYDGERIVLLSQRDIIRVCTEGRKIMLQTEERAYYSNTTLTHMEDLLNPARFLRISQSEIVNLYKVKCFSLDTAGTIGIEFENGAKSWASRSRVKAIKALIREYM